MKSKTESTAAEPAEIGSRKWMRDFDRKQARDFAEWKKAHPNRRVTHPEVDEQNFKDWGGDITIPKGYRQLARWGCICGTPGEALFVKKSSFLIFRHGKFQPAKLGEALAWWERVGFNDQFGKGTFMWNDEIFPCLLGKARRIVREIEARNN